MQNIRDEIVKKHSLNKKFKISGENVLAFLGAMGFANYTTQEDNSARLKEIMCRRLLRKAKTFKRREAKGLISKKMKSMVCYLSKKVAL